MTPAFDGGTGIDSLVPALFTVLVAPFVGSFLGTLVLRLPARRPVLLGRSACDHCGRTLDPRDLVPILSWAASQGRTSCCGRPLTRLYLVSEVLAMLVPFWALLAVPVPLVLPSALLGWQLLALALIDWRTRLLPDALTLPLAFTGLAAGWWLDGGAPISHLLGGAVGFVLFAAIKLVYRRARAHEGLGAGDVKLMAAIGCWIGGPAIATVVFYGGLIGLIVEVLQRRGHAPSRDTPLPFGTYLCIAAWLVWLYGPLKIGWPPPIY